MAGLTLSQVASLNPYSSDANNLRLQMAESDGSIMGNLKALKNAKNAKFKNFGNKIAQYKPKTGTRSVFDNFSYLGGRPGSTTNAFR
jgi:hypothetical protein